MRCPACDADNHPGSRFCSTCGSPLAAASSPGAYTPPHLARKILLARGGLVGERKLVTVLFADLKGSMELIVQRDPEEANALLAPVLERMMEAVHRYEGTVNQVMGDGIMALFGAPVAHEDHAVRACYAALRMQASVRRYAADVQDALGIPVQIRIGLNSGQVVVRSVGSDLRTDYTAVGETTHLAARMEQMAAPGSIYLAGATCKLVEGYVQTHALGPKPVKGLPGPVDVHELTGVGPARSRLQAVAGHLSPFVGREREHAVLLDALEQARARHGQLVAVIGEPGVGKSRLYWEFARTLATTDWRVIKVGAVSHGKAVLWGPVVDLLRGYFSIGTEDSPDEVRDRVVSSLSALGVELTEAASALLALLEVPVDDEGWTALEPPRRRRRTLDAVKQLLARGSQSQPLVVIVEDLHWVDSETQTLLDELIEALPTLRALVLVNYRPEYQHTWVGKVGYHALPLEPLGQANVDDLRAALLGDDPSLAPLAPLLDARAQGNPFFLEEIVRALAATGTLEGTPGAYRLARPVEALEVPATVQALLAARIDRVDPEDKALLQAAAVIGEPIAVDLLGLVTDRAGASLHDGLVRLEDAGLVYGANDPGAATYHFKHALTQQVAYESLLAVQRRGVHARVVGAIEQRHSHRLDEWLPHLAHHALRGEVWDQAMTYCRRAALRAIQRAAYPLASSLLEDALAALSRLPESRTTLEAGVDTRRELYASLWGLLGTDRRVGERMIGCMQEALPLAETLGDEPRMAMVLSTLAQGLMATGQITAGVEMGLRALTHLEGSESPRDGVHYVLSQSYRGLGDYRRSAAHAEQAQGMARPGLGEAQNPASARWRANLALSLADVGDFERGLALAAEGRRIAESARHPFSLLDALWAHAVLYLRRGALTEAIVELEQGLERARAWGVPLFVRVYTPSLGYAYALTGRLAEAIPLVENPLAGFGNEALFTFYLGETYALAERLADATISAERGLGLCEERGLRGVAAWGERLLGLVTALRDPHDLERSADHYRRAIERADEVGARPLAARCRLDFGRACARAGRGTEAVRRLTEAAEMLRDMGMVRWLEAAELELSRIAGTQEAQ